MKLLLDACMCRHAVEFLRSAEHDVEWVGEWDADPGDAEILRQAYSNQRILVTLDKDFGEFAVLRDTPHCGIVRIARLAAREQGLRCEAALKRYAERVGAWRDRNGRGLPSAHSSYLTRFNRHGDALANCIPVRHLIHFPLGEYIDPKRFPFSRISIHRQ